MTTTPPDPDPRTDPVAPFGATVQGAADLVPEARLRDAPPTAGQFGITVAQAAAWVVELTGVVALRLDRWERLSDRAPAEGVPSDRASLVDAARTIVHNGVGSYIEDARHPERSSVNTTEYGAVLWERYRTQLDDLAEWLRRRLANPDDGDEGAGGIGGAAGGFPPPFITDTIRW
ncbi:MAG: hypothetical protein RR101_14295 [Burkholderiaceae bacterium]